MDPERWKRVDDIFQAALNHEPSARAAYLEVECKNDDTLRTEVEQLIANHEKQSSLFENPATDLAAAFFAEQGMHKDTIAHYKIIKKIGSGGMGDVYLAEDTRLNRNVAIKVLPSEFTKDKERIRRFEREARALSALNHPYILTVHDIGQIDSSTFIVSEYIEGETLRHQMRASKIPLKEILTIVIQVAEALDAAHRVAIIHRDIKPENIMLRHDGYVKLLDFGLSKSIETEITSEVSNLETSTRTQQGVVLGTTRYMSPEQIRGLKLDARSDIFSLGIVLYELISGNPPFNGATSADIVAAILEKNPAPIRTHGQFPGEVLRIIAKMLAKDPDERYQTTKDLLVDLKQIKKELDISEELESRDSSASASHLFKKIRPAGVRTAAVLVVLMIIAAAIIVFTQREQKETPPPQKPFSKIKLTRLTSTGTARRAAISPDGKYVTYLQESKPDERNLYLKQLTSDTEILLIKPSPDTYFYGGLSFSNDGEYIYYLTLQPSKSKIGSFYQIPVLGGISQKLIEDIEFLPTISPDGKKFAFVRKVKEEQWLMTARIDGSDQLKIRSHKLPDEYNDIAWSPDGRIIAAILFNGAQKQIVGIRLTDGSQQPIYKKNLHLEAWNDLEWLPDGRGLVLSTDIEGKNQIGLLSYPDGALSSITNDYNHYGGVSLTRDAQSLVTTQLAFYSALWVAPSAKPDAVTQVTTGSLTEDGNTGLSWTPDGKILYRTTMPSEEYQLCLINPDGTNRKQITTGPPNKHWPVTSPDGRTIVYNTEEEGQSIMKIWRMNVDGSDPRVVSHRTQARWPRFSPDSKWIVFSTLGQEKQALIKLKLEDSKEITLATHRTILGAAISPNGSQIAYVHEENEGFILNIISSENGARSKTIVLEHSAIPNGRIHWTPDGRGISYLNQDEDADVPNIFIQPIDGSPPQQLTHFTTDMIGNYCWSMDGKQIAYSLGKKMSFDIVLIESLR